MALIDRGQYSGVVDIARNGIDEVLRLKKQVKQGDALIAQMLDFLEDVQDEGPIGEGWKSDKLMATIAAASARLDSTARRKHV